LPYAGAIISTTYAKKSAFTVEIGYEEIFGVKKEQSLTFNDLAEEYEKNYGNQKSFRTFKRHAVRYLREAFGEKRLKDISYLDLETYRNRRKATLA
jgi:hypothetical protein